MYGPGGERWKVRVGGDDGTFDVYHRPNLERARKGRLPLVLYRIEEKIKEL